MNQKPIIFLTVSRAIIVRNLLLNQGFFKKLSDKYEVVLLSPHANDSEFQEILKGFLTIPLLPRKLNRFTSWLEQKFISLHKALIYNPSVKIASEYGIMLRNPVKFKRLRNNLEKYFFSALGKMPFVRTFLKRLDKMIFPCSAYDEAIQKYKPELIFITALGSDDEVALLRNSKKHGIKNVGMTVSWDNLSKNGMREKVDRLIVWSEYMKEEATRFQGYSKDEVEVIGIPQFDHYVHLPLISKQEFCSQFGLDANKKTILFGSSGPVGKDDTYMISFLRSEILNGKLSDFQILIRPHLAYKNEYDRFLESIDNRVVFMDMFKGNSHFKDRTALNLEGEKNLKAQVHYSDVVIAGPSTFVLDVAVNGKTPLICDFDKDKNTPYGDSIHRLYNTLWFLEIRKFLNASFVSDEVDLVEKIKRYGDDHDSDKLGRDAMIARLCHHFDGKSGERLFAVVDNHIQT